MPTADADAGTLAGMGLFEKTPRLRRLSDSDFGGDWFNGTPTVPTPPLRMARTALHYGKQTVSALEALRKEPLCRYATVADADVAASVRAVNETYDLAAELAKIDGKLRKSFGRDLAPLLDEDDRWSPPYEPGYANNAPINRFRGDSDTLEQIQDSLLHWAGQLPEPQHSSVQAVLVRRGEIRQALHQSLHSLEQGWAEWTTACEKAKTIAAAAALDPELGGAARPTLVADTAEEARKRAQTLNGGLDAAYEAALAARPEIAPLGSAPAAAAVQPEIADIEAELAGLVESSPARRESPSNELDA